MESAPIIGELREQHSYCYAFLNSQFRACRSYLEIHFYTFTLFEEILAFLLIWSQLLNVARQLVPLKKECNTAVRIMNNNLNNFSAKKSQNHWFPESMIKVEPVLACSALMIYFFHNQKKSLIHKKLHNLKFQWIRHNYRYSKFIIHWLRNDYIL